MSAALASLYVACVGALAVWGVHRFLLLRAFRRSPWQREAVERVAPTRWPFVTVQLPIFNERNVVERLIRAVGALRYPLDRLEIQVLDDSSDETTPLARAAVQALTRQGVDAHYLRRPDRTGFKAGALDHGLRSARGELVAIFDADFVPEPDFLERLVAEFDAPEVGMVQARWGHINRDQSVLTRAQSALLDGHFVIEHTARAASNHFFNFNGTAGIWRRAAIDGAGGWEHDTLTEDLDLSYRAQLAGWRFVYRPDVVAPAEVPADLTAFKNQQQRWARGSAQVLRKLGPRLLRAPIPLRVRVEALAHLTGNIGYPLVLVLAVTMPMALELRGIFGHLVHLLGFLICTGTVVAFYVASMGAAGRTRRERLLDVPAGLALGVGMSISQSLAVARGLFGGAGEFVRTPKRGDRGAFYRPAGRGLPGAELLVGAWIAWAIWHALALGRYGALPFLALFMWGFGWVGWRSVRERGWPSSSVVATPAKHTDAREATRSVAPPSPGAPGEPAPPRRGAEATPSESAPANEVRCTRGTGT